MSGKSLKLISILHILMVLGGCDEICESVGNIEGTAHLRIENNLIVGVQWYMSEYSFGTEMKSGECTLFTLSEGAHIVEINRCTDVSCINIDGVSKSEEFSVKPDETHTIQIDENYFIF